MQTRHVWLFSNSYFLIFILAFLSMCSNNHLFMSWFVWHLSRRTDIITFQLSSYCLVSINSPALALAIQNNKPIGSLLTQVQANPVWLLNFMLLMLLDDPSPCLLQRLSVLIGHFLYCGPAPGGLIVKLTAFENGLGRFPLGMLCSVMLYLDGPASVWPTTFTEVKYNFKLLPSSSIPLWNTKYKSANSLWSIDTI